jgi:NADH dehydrogenase
LIFVEFRKDYPSVPIDQAQVLLYEHAPTLLRMFKPELQAYATEELKQRGVRVQTGCGVAKIAADSITLSSSEVVKTKTLIWAAGLEASPVTSSLGVELVRGGRIPVGPDLQVHGYPGVFAVGDIAAMTDGKTGEVLPGLGATALQAGKHAGTAISDLVLGNIPAPFKYLDKGSMATITRFHAVASVGKIRLAGFFAWLMWLGVHVMYLVGFKNRLTTMLHWAVSFIFRGRSQRTTTRQQIVARTLMARLSATEEALKQAQEQPEDEAKQIESGETTAADASGDAGADRHPEPVEGRASTSSAPDDQPETVGTDSVDELTAAFGDTEAEGGDAVPLKQAPES